MEKLILFLVISGFVSIYALTEQEMKAEFTKIVMSCLKTHPVEMSELMELQKLIPPKKLEVKCLLACAYKKEGVMNAKGMYDLQHAYEVAELGKNGDEKRLENGKKMADLCVKVNDVKVSDGDKGCERAGLIFKCTVDNAPKMVEHTLRYSQWLRRLYRYCHDNKDNGMQLQTAFGFKIQ